MTQQQRINKMYEKSRKRAKKSAKHFHSPIIKLDKGERDYYAYRGEERKGQL